MYLQNYFYNTISNDWCRDQKEFLKFCPPQVLKFTHFKATICLQGIPNLCRYFARFNPITLLADDLEVFNLKSSPTDGATLKWQMEYINNYIMSVEFKQSPKNVSNDYIIYSIFAYIFLNWSPLDLNTFGQTYPNVLHFCKEIIYTNKEDKIVIVRGLPFTGATFRIINRHLLLDFDQKELELKEKFSIKDYVSYDHLNMFEYIYNQLCNESWRDGDEQLLYNFESKGLLFPILENLQHLFTSYDNRPKYITGMACCGKTSFLQMMTKHGWMFKSRGEIGAFGGKAKSPSQIAAKHASMDFVLRKFPNSIIGDRGPIDNPLWNAIMPLCAPKYKTRMVEEILLFFENSINEGSIGYFGEFIAVIFLDMYPSRNRQRMIARSTGGDSYRGRLPMYAIAQFMAYYIFAVLFGYKIITVPYNENDEIDFNEASNIGKVLNDYFGQPESLTDDQKDTLNFKHVSRNVRDLISDMSYPHLSCILK